MKLTYEYNGYVHPDRLVKPRIAVSVDFALAGRLDVTDALPHVIEHVRSVFKAAALALAGKPHEHVESYAHFATLPDYDGSIVNVWGDIQIPTEDGGLHIVGLNVCDERVSSREIVDSVNMLLEALNPPPRHDRPSAPRKPAPAPPPVDDGKPWHTGGGDRTVYKPDGKADLKKTFPRGGSGGAPKPAPQGDVPVNFDELEYFDYQNPQQYADGNVHHFPIAAIQNAIRSKKDGSGTFHVVDFLKANGKPIYDLRVFVPQDGSRKNFDWLAVREFVTHHIPNPGDIIEGKFVLRVKVKPKNSGDGYFFNHQGIDTVEVQRAAVRQADATSNDDAPQLPDNVDEIPF